MAAIIGRTDVGVRQFGNSATVPPDPQARLMYYLECISTVLDLSDQENLTRLRDYSCYYSLTEEEIDELLSLCFLLSPDELSEKVIFMDAEMCGDENNAFFEISAVRQNLDVSDSIIIGGQQRHVSKIMAFKGVWLETFWGDPMEHFTPRLAQIAASGSGTPAAKPVMPHRAAYAGSSACCTIL